MNIIMVEIYDIVFAIVVPVQLSPFLPTPRTRNFRRYFLHLPQLRMRPGLVGWPLPTQG